MGFESNLLEALQEQTTSVATASWHATRDEAGKQIKLYHYTDAAALKSIVENGRLWATHIEYLNDSRELTHALDVLAEEVQRRLSLTTSPVQRVLLTKALTTFNRSYFRTHDFYITCFCAAPDLLSQWRGYGRDGGYAIGLVAEELDKAIKLMPATQPTLNKGEYCGGTKNHVYESMQVTSVDLEIRPWIVPVSYNLQHQTATFGSILQLAQNFVETRSRTMAEGEIDAACVEVVAKISIAIASASVSMKDPGFREEAEWRLLYMATPEFKGSFRTAGSVTVRVAASGLTPYLDVKLRAREDSRRGLLPIREVIVGPSVSPKLAAEGVRFLLDRHGYDDVHIDTSKIPLRN